MPKGLLDIVDSNLPDQQMADWLEYALEQVELVPEEVELLRIWSREAGPKTRHVASNYLFWNGPCSFEEIKNWATDADADVRYQIINDISTFGESSVAGRVCLEDKERCIKLISSVAERYPEDWPSIGALRDFALQGGEWLDLSWREANRLLDLNDIDLNTQLIVAYFEHVVVDMDWGPNDQYIRSWIVGSDTWRQIILLRVAAWKGLDEGKLREIVQALTHSRDKDISSIAKGVLEGRIKYGDF